MSINVTLLDNAEPKLEVSEVPEVPITLEPEVPEVEDKNILNLLELEEVDLTPPLSETCDLREENKLLTTIVDISSSTEPHEEKEEDLGLDIPEFNFEETINLDDLTVANDDPYKAFVAIVDALSTTEEEDQAFYQAYGY